MPFNPWNAKIDWKDDKNEILFHKEYATEDNSSPLTRKIKNLQDHFEGPVSETNFTPNTKNLTEEKVIEDKGEILNSFKENIKDESMIRKNMELSSINQGTEFYKSNAKYYSVLDRAVKKYEVNEIKYFENLKEKEIENLFRNKGYSNLINYFRIHIYDLKSSGAYINGNTNGHLSFKIRENSDDVNFHSNMVEIKNEMNLKMGLNVQPESASPVKKT